MLPWILCGILLLINLSLLCRIYFLHSGIEEICTQFDQRLRKDTNNLIYVSSRDSHIRRLAARLSMELGLLRRQRHRYENGDRKLKEAVTDISHDLRTPLTAISGYLELLEQQEQTDTVRRYLSQIRSRTEAMKKLAEELFDYSVIISVPQQQLTELTLNGVLEEELAACYTQLTHAGITPCIRLPEAPVQRVLDRASLGRILGNILGNAAKYSGGDLEVCLNPDGHITFSNSSPNLTPVMVEHLFDRFYTVETARHSTGLGLSIARVLTERMGGVISAACRSGQLTITLYFP
ncbi:MAG: HAMP domain-containing histidine kinase [Acetatifactor sp.]|nr:HAMP domain-containing histidine kinase [Acetatifactor sp.]